MRFHSTPPGLYLKLANRQLARGDEELEEDIAITTDYLPPAERQEDELSVDPDEPGKDTP